MQDLTYKQVQEHINKWDNPSIMGNEIYLNLIKENIALYNEVKQLKEHINTLKLSTNNKKIQDEINKYGTLTD